MISKTICLVDHHWEGHHLTYLKLFAKTLLNQNHNVIIISPKNEDIAKWLERETGSKNYFTYPAPILYNSSFRFKRLRPTIDFLRNWKNIKQIIKKVNSDHNLSIDLVFFNWFDDFLKPLPKWVTYWIPFYLPRKWGGLTFQARRFYNNNLSNEKLLINNLLRIKSCKVIATLDEGLLDLIQEKEIQKKITIFPDITYSDVAEGKIIKKILKEAHGRKIISLIGALDHRKGLLTLLKVADRLIDNSEYFFVFAGKPYRTFPADLQQEVDNLISMNLSNSYFYLDYIESDSEFNGIVKISDILFLVYDNFDFSSNLLTKAAIFKKPVITSKDTLMGDRVIKYGTGKVVTQGSVEETIQAIMHIKKINKNNYQRYVKDHSIDALDYKFKKIINML